MSEVKRSSPLSAAASAAGMNGVGVRGLPAEEAAKLNAISKRTSAALGEIINIMSRSPHHRHAFLSDLEWMVRPALAAGQFAIAEGRHKDSGLTAPRAVIFWASVSKAVENRLMAGPVGPIRLKPSEWSSGPNAWLIDAIGDPRVVKALIDRTLSGPLKGRTLKVATRAAGGKLAVQEMKAPEVQAEAAAGKS